MALADFEAMRNASEFGCSYISAFYKNTSTISHVNESLGRNLISQSPDGITTPTTAVALTDRPTFLGPSNGSGRAIISKYQGHEAPTASTERHPSYLLIDRLNEQGGLVGNLNTTQTTNLPTAALTRYTSGVGVQIGLHIYGTWGTTNTTVSVSYTNSAGTPGQTGVITMIDTPGPAVFYWVGLQSGDVGAKSVESVTLSVSTGTAGNGSVFLFKPLAYLGDECDDAIEHDPRSIPGWNTAVEDGSYLDVVMLSGWESGTFSQGQIFWSVV
jgi:hypothetical protein